jgi:hypothetical protein
LYAEVALEQGPPSAKSRNILISDFTHVEVLLAARNSLKYCNVEIPDHIVGRKLTRSVFNKETIVKVFFAGAVLATSLFLSLSAMAADKNTQATCSKTISFAYAESGQPIRTMVPHFVQKWIKKNQGKHPSVCFSQTPAQGTPNYLFVFSTSSSAYSGFYPTVRTSTNTSPVSGSGMVTDSYGSTWQYSYSGTVTTTTTEHYNAAYTDTTETLYLYAYGQNGTPVSQRWRGRTVRAGGDGWNTLGYNLGSWIATAHFPEKLLADVVKDVESLQ